MFIGGGAKVSKREFELVGAVPKGLLIGGEWRPAEDGRELDVENPATGTLLARVADASKADAMSALDAAAHAQPKWAGTPPRTRSEVLRRAFELVMARADDFALLMTLEMGKPLAEAKAEVEYGAEFLRWFAEEAIRTPGRYATAPDGRSRLLVASRPVGPCLLVTPWNFPLAMATRKVAPAVAAGCTMVLKPSELTPLTAALFMSVMLEAGLPPGVVNLVICTDPHRVIMPLLADPRLRKLSFTGSTAVGRQLLAASAGRVLRTSMELGGNAPFIVFPDADIDAALDGAMIAKMRNMGQACTAANRFLVHREIAKEFSSGLAERVRSLRLGRGTAPDTQVGPLITSSARARIARSVEAGLEAGGTLLAGGSAADGCGYFYRPTVIDAVPPASDIVRQEIFGPVAPIMHFSSEEEAYRIANDTDFGLAAYVYTRDLSRALRAGERLETGMLALNSGMISNASAPFGGIKQSGLGREGGTEGMSEYLSTQYLAIADPFAVGARDHRTASQA